MKEVSALARRYSLPIHLDGARLFNAATALGVRAADIAAQVDSVMFCLSKGLCAPVGSMLVGPRDFIEKARRKRKIMGGGMRQVGILAAAGLIALKEMTGRLAEDHANARYLANKLAQIPGIRVDMSALDINMVFFAVPEGLDGPAFAAALRARGVLVNPPEAGQCRFVTHYWIDRSAIDAAVKAVAEIFDCNVMPGA